MARQKSQTLTDGELKIMDVVWSLGEATVRDVTDELNRQEPVAYNTVQTMLGILTDKGYLSHRKQGRAFLYRPLIDKNTAQRTALKHLIGRFFAGSPSALVQNLLESDEVDALEIDRLRQLIEQDEDDQ